MLGSLLILKYESFKQGWDPIRFAFRSITGYLVTGLVVEEEERLEAE